MPPALSTAPQPDQRRTAPSIEPITMRVPDACRFVGISRSTLYLLIASRDVEVIKLGASTLVLTESLRRFVEGRRSAKPTPAEGR